MFDKDMLEAKSYEEYKALKESLGEIAAPFPAWLSKYGEYCYAKLRYPHVDMEDALVLVQRDIGKAFAAMRSDSTCCGGGSVK